ncbi:hypothetical protein NDU88_003518 [Pleurodeles waltl]|uniref:Uncharacterized protein n=1 Tax=Pleurodeles waltl TaxID=8319 RepID=A0AAV7REI3_PLEWA|nr:hypothetical protein NDU88_003518 [Pleurodeles waltl]
MRRPRGTLGTRSLSGIKGARVSGGSASLALRFLQRPRRGGKLQAPMSASQRRVVSLSPGRGGEFSGISSTLFPARGTQKKRSSSAI